MGFQYSFAGTSIAGVHGRSSGAPAVLAVLHGCRGDAEPESRRRATARGAARAVAPNPRSGTRAGRRVTRAPSQRCHTHSRRRSPDPRRTPHSGEHGDRTRACRSDRGRSAGSRCDRRLARVFRAWVTQCRPGGAETRPSGDRAGTAGPRSTGAVRTAARRCDRPRARGVAPPGGPSTVPMEGFEFKVLTSAMWRRSERRPVVRTALDKLLEVVRRRPGARVVIQSQLLPPAGAGSTRRSSGGRVPLMVEIRHLRALLAVAGARSIGRAAEQLGVAQPSVSRQLNELEHAVGVPLLERSARGVILTPAGASLAEDCPELLLSLEQLFEEATRARRGMEARCVVGAVATTVTSAILTGMLTECAARHPEVRVMIEEMASPLQPPALARGKIDLGLAHSYVAVGGEQAFARHRIAEDRVDAALLGSGHPLARRRKLAAADLADVPFLFPERAFHPGLYDLVLRALASIGLTPRIDATYDGLPAVWSLVAQGKGWCLGFRSQRARPPAGTVVLPITGFNLPWGIDVIYRRDERSAAVQAVIRLIRPNDKRRRPRNPLAPPSGSARVSAAA